MRPVFSVIAGLIVGGVVITVLQFASAAIYPPPEGLDLKDREALAAWVKELPAAALLFVILSHSAGAFTGAFVCNLISKNRWLLGWLIIGGAFLGGGIMNATAIPHPVWFAVLDLLLYLPSAVVGGLLASVLTGKTVPSVPA